MKVNCHIDPNIEEEHLDLFVREMNPQINNLLKGFTSCILQNRSTQLCNIIIHSCVMKKAIV